MTVSHVIEKPFREGDALNHLVRIAQQEKFPTQQRSLERRMLQEILLGNLKKAKEFRATLEKNEAYPEARRVYNSALFSFYANDFEKARNDFLKAIQLGGDHLSCVNMLGKCFLRLRNFKDAIACFEKAAALSPKNIERMCAMAESHLGDGDADAAKLAVKAAESLDADSAAVKHVAARVEVEVGDVRKASKLFANLGSLPTLVADMNNSAVAMVRTKEFQRGISLYEKTLAALPPKETGLRIRVTYNMVLAYVRMNDLEKAEELLKTIPEDYISPVMGKVHKLQKKVRSALMQGRDVSLESNDVEPAAPAPGGSSHQGGEQSRSRNEAGGGEVAGGEKSTPVQLSPEEMVKREQEHVVFSVAGDRCCHMIFRSAESKQSESRLLLANMPQLKTRDPIKREESFRNAAATKES
jgi:tetratricopeptide (TPR) repeat protein